MKNRFFWEELNAVQLFKIVIMICGVIIFGLWAGKVVSLLEIITKTCLLK